jgi:hypothetical protein
MVRKAERFLPLYEAKMIHLFDHRFGTYEGQTEAQANKGFLPQFDAAAHADPSNLPLPYYWVAEPEVAGQLADKWHCRWLLGWRDICRSSDMRTVISAAIPRSAVGDKFLLALPCEKRSAAALLGSLTSLVVDYCARQKVGGTSLKYYVMKQLPVLPPDAFDGAPAWAGQLSTLEWITPRVLELSYTAWDLEPFADDLGHPGPPFRWDAARRAILRAELDAAFFHLYGLDRSETEWVLDTFPVLRDRETRAHGEYRTRRLVLERYDALAAASPSRPYVTPLDPPPASPAMRHPPRAS